VCATQRKNLLSKTNDRHGCEASASPSHAEMVCRHGWEVQTPSCHAEMEYQHGWEVQTPSCHAEMGCRRGKKLRNIETGYRHLVTSKDSGCGKGVRTPPQQVELMSGNGRRGRGELVVKKRRSSASQERLRKVISTYNQGYKGNTHFPGRWVEAPPISPILTPTFMWQRVANGLV
jgi:hypothetical protein